MTTPVEDIFAKETLVLEVPKVIDHLFIENLVELLKGMLIFHNTDRDVAYLQPKEIHLIFPETFGIDDREQDFDLVFFGYITLIKSEFPSIIVKIFYPEIAPKTKSADLFYQLLQHKTHLQIMCGKEIFKLYLDGEEKSGVAVQSDSYLPIFLVNSETINGLFKERNKQNSFRTKFEGLVASKSSEILSKKSEANRILRQEYKSTINPSVVWRRDDLSALYLLEAMLKLPTNMFEILKLPLTLPKKTTSIGNNCRASILKVIEEFDLFSFSDMEIYCFSMLLHSGEVFQVPADEKQMIERLSAVLEVSEVPKKKAARDELVKKFHLVYEENFRKLVQDSKSLAYGVFELAKNMVEHTRSGCGIITARIYNHKRIRRLKRIDPRWIGQFRENNFFVDINAFDSGRSGICTSYFANLNNERTLHSSEVDDTELKSTIQLEYDQDMEEVKRYKLNNFFDFNSIKLFHQINRTKARLGLLIFSQSILSESRAFVKAASNNIEERYPEGYAMFEQKGLIKQEDMSDFYKLGTNYNFIVPIANVFEKTVQIRIGEYQEVSTPSSVFLELQNYYDAGTMATKSLNVFKLPNNSLYEGKYRKLDLLKEHVMDMGNEGIVVLNAGELSRILENSSDWVRFLANLQFTTNGVKETIVVGITQELYAEIVNILAIFDRAPKGEVGFWKQDRYVLFFVPIRHHFDQLEANMDEYALPDIFWFNSLLCGIKFQHFVNVNLDINQYHNNMANVTVGLIRKKEKSPPGMKGPLFSSSGKLLNFELVLENQEKISLFEETTRSLVNVEIQDL